MAHEDEQIARLKAQLADLEAKRAGSTAAFKPKFPHRIVAFVVIAAIGIMIWVTAGLHWSAPPEKAAISPHAALSSQVRMGPLTEAERASMVSLVREAYPREGARATDVVEFYFDGDPTMCGTVGTVRLGTQQRFLAKNGTVALERDLRSADFDMFWQICQAGGAR